MHRCFRRQLRKYLGVEDEVPAALRGFVAAVDAAYADFDSDRAMLERSLELSSKELSDARDQATEARGPIDRCAGEHLGRLLPVRLDDRMVLCTRAIVSSFPAWLTFTSQGWSLSKCSGR